MAVVADGRPSMTGYRVRERFAGWTLLELDLVTGRTHQIRVHLDAIGHPVAGDPVYGTGTSRRGPGRRSTGCSSTPGGSSSPRRRAAASSAPTAPLPPELGAGPRRAPRRARLGGSPVTDQIFDISADPGRPASVVDGAPGAMLVIISGPSGVGKDTIIDALRRASRTTRDVPLRRDLHDAGAAARRGRRRRLPLPDPRRRSSRSAPPAASSRRTRSTATGTARPATRSARRSPPAAT